MRGVVVGGAEDGVRAPGSVVRVYNSPEGRAADVAMREDGSGPILVVRLKLANLEPETPIGPVKTAQPAGCHRNHHCSEAIRRIKYSLLVYNHSHTVASRQGHIILSQLAPGPH